MKNLLTVFLAIVLFAIPSCAESKKSAKEVKELSSNDFSFDVKIIINNMPIIDETPSSTYAIVNFHPKKDAFKTNWRLKKLTINEVVYYTFDNNEFNGINENSYTNNVREIKLTDHKTNGSIEFENERQEVVKFSFEMLEVVAVD